MTCQVAETNVPDGAKVTIVDSDDLTAGGESDGIVANPSPGEEHGARDLNTFTTPPGIRARDHRRCSSSAVSDFGQDSSSWAGTVPAPQTPQREHRGRYDPAQG